MTKAKSNIDQDLIRELAKLLEETGLSELEIEQEGTRIRVARGGRVVAARCAGARCRRPGGDAARHAGRGCRETSRRRDLADGRHRLSLAPRPAPSLLSRSAHA